MKYLIILLTLLTFNFSTFLTPIIADEYTGNYPNLTKEEINTKLEEAKAIYLDYYKDSMNLDRSIKILADILEVDPKNLQAMIFLSRVWLTYGYAKAPNDGEKIRVFKNGIDVAKKAIEIAPNNPDAHFFYVANLGSLGETHGVLRSLFLLPKIRKELELILELDPNHVYGLGMTGLLYYSLPSFLGGDLHISEIYLRRAMRFDAHLAILKIYLAKTLMKQKKYEEAKKILKEVIEEKNPSIYADWHINKEIARNILAKIEKKTQRRLSSPESIKSSIE
ncbi:MAG: tetratricopeptide repeat protein [Thermodesulfobacteriota bacterium]